MKFWLSSAARLPLYVKLIGLFFLNILLLAGVVVFLVNAQLRLDLDWVLFGSARERVETMHRLVVNELNSSPTYEWARVLEQFSNAYGVQLALFDDDEKPLVGPVRVLPLEVHERLHRFPFGPAPKPGVSPSPAPSPGSDVEPPPRPRWHGHGPPVRIFMHSADPNKYWLLVSIRIDNPQVPGPFRALLVAQSNSFSEGGLIFDLRPWLIFGAGAVVFTLLFWLPFVTSITRSVRQMTLATQKIAEGRFDVRVASKRSDELGLLGDAINQMAIRLDGFVAGQKRFLGDVAHELCSPLARLQMALGIVLQRTDANDKTYTYAKAASEKAELMASLVNDLLTFSKASIGASTVRLQPVRVGEAVAEAVRRESIEGKQVNVNVPEGIVVSADSELLTRAIANLVRNALTYAGDAGPVSATASTDPTGYALISVADMGAGVRPEDLTKIFDAFYRPDPSRARTTGGVGLGLTIVKTCVESCRGTVMARNRVPSGFEVTIRLPLAGQA